MIAGYDRNQLFHLDLQILPRVTDMSLDDLVNHVVPVHQQCLSHQVLLLLLESLDLPDVNSIV